MADTVTTIFKELNIDFLRQLILRTETLSGQRVDTLWMDRSLMGDLIKNLTHETDPVCERDMLLSGYIGDLTIEAENLLDDVPRSFRILREPASTKDIMPIKGVHQLWGVGRVDLQQIQGVDAQGNILFTATREDNVSPQVKRLLDKEKELNKND